MAGNAAAGVDDGMDRLAGHLNLMAFGTVREFFCVNRRGGD